LNRKRQQHLKNQRPSPELETTTQGIETAFHNVLGRPSVEEPVHVHDLHATILHFFELEHTNLTNRFSARDFRLTGVSGTVIHGLTN
jgi:hypothetical protein